MTPFGPDPHPSIALAEEPVRFAGRRWWLRASDTPTGAGPSRWSAAGATVRDDGLHLTLRSDERGAVAVEVMTPVRVWACTGLTLRVAGGTAALPDDVVVAAFLYRDDRSELDVELSRWGDPSAPAGQFVVAPARPERMLRFELPTGPLRVELGRWRGQPSFGVTGDDGGVRWVADVSPERAPRWLHLSVWRMGGVGPPDASPVELIVSAVRRVPCRQAADAVSRTTSSGSTSP